MVRTEWSNQMTITEFVLLGFGNLQELQIFHFLLFLVIHIVTMAGNILIVELVVVDQHFTSPCTSSWGTCAAWRPATAPPSYPGGWVLTGHRTISFLGCVMKYYFFGCLVETECYLLGAMSYDCYLAIWKPLHCTTIMNTKQSFQLAADSWICGLLTNTITTSLMSQLFF
ncbi:unnamed protein product [Natator depressus]